MSIVSVIDLANEILGRNKFEAPYPLAIDPFMKPSNMRVVMTVMYCDDPNNLQRVSLCVPIPTNPLHMDREEFENQVVGELGRAFSKLNNLVNAIPTPACTVHQLIQSDSDGLVYCGRCEQEWVPKSKGNLTEEQ